MSDYYNNILETRNLKKFYPVYKGLIFPHIENYIKAVDDVSFAVGKGEIVGIVGESGCGKTTLVKTIIQLEKATAGEILFKGKDITKIDENDLKYIRKDIQLIFQNPYSSLDPVLDMKTIIEEPLIEYYNMNKNERKSIIYSMIEKVGLNPAKANNYPSEFSGGQRQRIAIARALVVEPELLLADEPVTALDVSVQAQIINLLTELKNSINFSMIFISHDLSIVRHISDKIAVMYLGEIVEYAGYKELFSNTLHPYSKILIGSIPTFNKYKKQTRMESGNIDIQRKQKTRGCLFESRCPKSITRCKQQKPSLVEADKGHYVSCWGVGK